jgi:protein O-GlcNAcase/histone acetyltransferase
MEREIGGHFMFCPTPYCGRMAKSKLGGEGYLETIGRELAPQIDIFWTGPEIISETITVEHAREMAGIFRRKPVIWDNLHANDYDGRRFFCGPYQGRALELKSEVNGILLNPNCEFPLNYAPLRTFGKFAQSKGGYDPRSEYVAAMTEWNRGMETFTGHVPLASLLMLGDCYYLPFEEGPLAEKLFAAVENLNAQELELMRCFCSDLAQLKDRALFAALHRRVWELREEMDLLEKFARNGGKATFSDFHLPKTYRGGVIPRLQRLLKQNEDGSFSRA